MAWEGVNYDRYILYWSGYAYDAMLVMGCSKTKRDVFGFKEEELNTASPREHAASAQIKKQLK